MSTVAPGSPAQPHDAEPPPAWTRRALLLGGLGAGVAAAANLSGAPSASATSGPMQYGANNYSGDNFTGLGSSNPNNTLFVGNSCPTGGEHTIPYTIIALGSVGSAIMASVGSGIGVQAHANTGTGLFARSASGPALRLQTDLAQPPATGTWVAGSLVATTGGELWLCVAAGTPGVWRRLSGPSSAGDFVPITPTRVFDSRLALPGPAAKIVPGAPRLVSVKDGRSITTGAVTSPDLVPPGTLAIAANITVTGTEGGGWLCASPGDAVAVTASSLNWNGPNQSVANGLALKLDSQRRLKIFVSTSATHVIVDVNGYYRAA